MSFFKSLNNFHYVIHFFVWNIKVVDKGRPEPCFAFFWIPASIAEAAGVITNGAQTFFAKGVATFINGTANLLTKDPKNPPDWIIWEIWALESIKISWHIVIK